MWSPVHDTPILSPGGLHVWQANLEVGPSVLAKYKSTLAKEEHERANKFRFAKNRCHYIVSRGILRHLLGNYQQLDPTEIIFHYSAYGKPLLANEESLQFNLSHSGGKALIGFSRNLKLGIDVERIRSDIEFEQIANRFFARKEVESLLSMPLERRPLGFFNCWTRKEAFIKAEGSGLSFPLDQFEVSLLPNEPAKLLATHWDDRELSKWSLFGLEPEEGFVGAAAVNGSIEDLKCFTLV